MDYIIEMNNITKQFNGNVANDHVTLQVKKGEVHALLGENGAGKSTLMNILFGLYKPDNGEIKVRGKKVEIDNPNIANELGIGMVHQHFMLIEKFTVTENIILGKEIEKGIKVDFATAEKTVHELSKQYGLNVDPKAKIEDISVGMQQRVEILKTLYRGSDILIFDEPTAVLTPQEIDELLQIMENLIAEGKTIILITHKLKEIMAICDRCTVLRQGKSIGTVNISDTDINKLSSMMVGRDVIFKIDKKKVTPKETILLIKDLEVTDSRGIKAVNRLNLDVKAGEIVGIAGVDGNGQTELLEAITGLRKAKSGEVYVNGKNVTNFNPRKVTLSGVGHIPQDRLKHGLILDFDIGENVILQSYFQEPYSKRTVINFSKMYEKARELIEQYDVRTPNEIVLAKSLSGGNQQKVVIARELDRSPSLVIAAQPTRGLDIGAIEYIHKKLIEERDNQKAVLLVSLDLDEILNLSDRVAVIYDGRIIEVLDVKEANEEKLGLLMAGGKREVGEST